MLLAQTSGPSPALRRTRCAKPFASLRIQRTMGWRTMCPIAHKPPGAATVHDHLCLPLFLLRL